MILPRGAGDDRRQLLPGISWYALCNYSIVYLPIVFITALHVTVVTPVFVLLLILSPYLHSSKFFVRKQLMVVEVVKS